MTIDRRLRIALLAGPALLYVGGFFLPLLLMGRMSADESEVLNSPGPWGTSNYAEIVTNPYYLTLWLNTLRLATVVAFITTVFGGTVAFALWRSGGRVRAYMTLVILAPLLVSGFVRGLGWVGVTGPAGMLESFTRAIGVGAVTVMFNETAVIIGLVHVLFPYAVLFTLASLDRIEPAVLLAASTLGANGLTRLRRIVLPLCRNALVASFLFVFASSATSYAIPAVLGGRSVLVASLSIYRDQRLLFDWPRASAQSILLIVVSFSALVAYQRLTRARARSKEVSAR